MLGNRELGKKCRPLERAGEPRPRPARRPPAVERAARERDRAGIGRNGAMQEADQRALAGPVRADQRMDLARHEVERHALDGEDAAIGLGEAARLEQGALSHGGDPEGR